MTGGIWSRFNPYRLHIVLGAAWLLLLLWMLVVVGLGTGGSPANAAGSWKTIANLNLVALGVWILVLGFDVAFGVLRPWGFGIRRDHWIALKWILTLAVAATQIFVLQPQATANARVLAHGTQVDAGPVMLLLLAQIAAVVGVAVIAVRKPWRGEETLVGR